MQELNFEWFLFQLVSKGLKKNIESIYCFSLT